MGFHQTHITDITGSDSLKTLGQIRSGDRKKKSANLFNCSKEGRPNPIPSSRSDEGGHLFTEELLEFARFATVFATGPGNLLKKVPLHLLYGLQKKHPKMVKGVV